MSKKRSLGRGLDALLGASATANEAAEVSESSLVEVAADLDKTLKERDETISSLHQQLEKQASFWWWLKSPWRFVKSWFVRSV